MKDRDAGTDETLASDAGAVSIASADTMGSFEGATMGSLPSGLPASPDSLPIVPPERYARIDEFARGGLGRIIRAIDQRTGRMVAIKEMLADSPDAAARFVREAMVTANLQHPAIVPVYEVGRWPDGKPFYAMKLVRGEPLHDVIAKTVDLDGRLALLSHVAAVADALAYAHEQHVIHRDLKPHNVLCGTHGETVVIDWGLARRLQDLDPLAPLPRVNSAPPGQTYVGAILGTPSYMAPEQARAERADERTDVYAIGAILYHLLSGRPPHTGKTIEELLARVKSETPPDLTTLDAQVPRDLAAICARAMSRERDQRYATAAECAADLRRFMTGQLVQAHHYTRGERLRRWMRRYRAVLAVAGIALAALVVVLTISVLRVIDSKNEATASRDETRQQLLASHLSRAGTELAAGHPDRALAFTMAAGELGEMTPTSRLIAGQALEMLAPLRRHTTTTIGAATFVPKSHDLVISGEELVRWAPSTDTVTWRLTGGHASDVHVVGASVAITRSQGLTFVNLSNGTIETTLTPSAGKPTGLLGRDLAGAWLATVFDDRIEIVNVAKRSVEATIPMTSVGRAPLISADGQRVVVVRTNTKKFEGLLVDRSGTTIATLCDCMRAIDAGNKLLVAPAGSPASLVVFDWNGTKLETIALGASPVSEFAVDTSKTRVVIAQNDGQVQVRDIATGAVQWTTQLREPPFSMKFDAERVSFLSTSAIVVALDANTGTELSRTRVSGTALLVSDDSAQIAAVAHQEGVVAWPARQRVITPVAPTPARVNAMQMNADGSLLAGTDDGKLVAVRGTEARVLGTSASIQTLQLLENGTILTADANDEVTLRDRDGKELVRFKAGHIARVSPDQKTLAAADKHGTIGLWDTAGTSLRTLGTIDRPLVLAWSSTGRLAAIGMGGSGIVWNADGSVLRKMQGGEYGMSLAWSPDGKWLSLAATGHKLYGTTDKDDRELRGMPPSANTLVTEFSADSSKVLLAGTGFLGVWSVATGEPLITVATSLITSATFIDGERYIAAGGGDRRIRVWEVSTGAELLSVPMPGNVLRMALDPTRTLLGIITARGAATWKRPSFEGDIDALRSIAACRSAVEFHDGRIRGRTIDTKACNLK
ncbi:MAG: protein kinase domain-containing protein [Kofleriaceae bacterium]